MSRDGSGTYNLPQSAFVFDTVISETAMNSNLSDIATALTGSIAADGQTTISANLPMNSKKLTGLAAGSDAGDSVNLGQVQAQAYIWCGTMTGTADAGALAPSPAITAYAAGQTFRWISSSNTNTGAMTVAVSGLMTKAVEINDAALAAGAHVASKMYEGTYDGTAFQIRRIAAPIAAASGANSDITSLTGLTTPLTVAQGGIGAATLVDGGILLGSGTDAITAMAALADSEMIVGDGTTDPVAESGATLRASIGFAQKAGTFTIDTTTATGTQAVTGVGFQPRAIIVFAAQSASAGEASWGFSDGTDALAIIDWNNTTADSFLTDGVTTLIADNQTGADTYFGDLNSFDADGFTIGWIKTGSPTGTLTCRYLAFI